MTLGSWIDLHKLLNRRIEKYVSNPEQPPAAVDIGHAQLKLNIEFKKVPEPLKALIGLTDNQGTYPYYMCVLIKSVATVVDYIDLNSAGQSQSSLDKANRHGRNISHNKEPVNADTSKEMKKNDEYVPNLELDNSEAIEESEISLQSDGLNEMTNRSQDISGSSSDVDYVPPHSANKHLLAHQSDKERPQLDRKAKIVKKVNDKGGPSSVGHIDSATKSQPDANPDKANTHGEDSSSKKEPVNARNTSNENNKAIRELEMSSQSDGLNELTYRSQDISSSSSDDDYLPSPQTNKLLALQPIEKRPYLDRVAKIDKNDYDKGGLSLAAFIGLSLNQPATRQRIIDPKKNRRNRSLGLHK